MSQVYYSYVKSPIGKLMVVGTRSALKGIMFPAGKNTQAPAPDWIEDAKYLKKAIAQLKAYFEGKLQFFDLELSPEGTAFQQSVWNALKEIPYGKTISYGEIAAKLGNPKASRAVGAANGKKPHSDCHSLPPGDWKIRRSDGVWRRSGYKREATHAGTRGRLSPNQASLQGFRPIES